MLILSVTALGFAAQGANARLKAEPASVPSNKQPTSIARPESTLSKVTIEATEERRALRLKVDRFVSSVVVQPWGDALYRWNEPICPLVAGLPKQYGEFILERISKAAIDAHAPLAGRVCRPNLYVVATLNPDPLLKMWWAHDRMMYNTRFGIEPVEHFIDSTRPIRAWYNTYAACGTGGMAPNSTITMGKFALLAAPPGCDPTNDLSTHLIRIISDSNISSAIVVVDGRQMKNITIRQMADYIALVGLADVRLDSDTTPAPSILELFSHGTPPQALTSWDRALLYSLYNSDQSSKLQVQQVEITMTKRIAR